ncbi:anti-phage-associated DUF3780 domain-containing protein [Marinobacter sp.]|jgi:hypothetical protein|uniref:anti-phage-associated DUF3780 domain-containing protein n=1 Tax=Marinobacter sp. TaxID=50741 RepID=UPI0025BCF4CA|nr:anti-phage-associated DUF3780 domain-containing protein [Marinobacter sp.]|tara:strand:- start:2377 stop:3030 length:654 start_codon:yes stop_codon:yes gene_type:complete
MELAQRNTEGNAMSQRTEVSGTGPRPTEGFGVPMTETNPHCFLVRVPRSNSGAVEIVENLGVKSKDDSGEEIVRVILDRPRWTAIRQEVQRIFNNRLKEHKLSTSRWKVGENPVDRLLGKELCVLAWAVEKMDEENIPMAVRNWMAFRPEERWWLFSMTAMSTGLYYEGDKGWRVALRHALGDVPQHELFKPRGAKKRPVDHAELPLDLFSQDTNKE